MNTKKLFLNRNFPLFLIPIVPIIFHGVKIHQKKLPTDLSPRNQLRGKEKPGEEPQTTTKHEDMDDLNNINNPGNFIISPFYYILNNISFI